MDDIRNTIICGNSLEVIPTWQAGSVDCCVTSPPYWGLRDYGLPPTKWPDGSVCCYGLEPTPELYVEHTVLIFREVWRVLKPEGTLWLNLGDSYMGSYPGARDEERWPKQRAGIKPNFTKAGTLPPKNLVGIPWMVAFALRSDGWYLRQDIIWHKPNPMPESVRDRCTKAHEYIFLLTKQPNYYCDMEAIKEAVTQSSIERLLQPTLSGQAGSDRVPGKTNGNMKAVGNVTVRNKRSVWTVTTKPYSEAHFATFPPDLIEPCILAGCPEQVCKKCGKARTRVTEKEQIKRDRPNNHVKYSEGGPSGQPDQTNAGCGCGAGFVPGIVLDPFMGSGTTAMVAYENRRDYIGCELNLEYIKLNRADKAKAKYSLFEK